MIGIYKIENVINGKKYIGSAINIDIRLKRHINDLKNKKHVNIHLQREYNKYGIENFIFECVEECEKDILKDIEQQYLNNIFLIKNNNLFYYNIGKDASGGDNLTYNPNKNIIIDKIKVGLIKRYENESDEDKVKRRNNLIGDKNPNYGKKWNDEQREKMSKQRKGLSSKIKGKTFEELHGKEKSDELKNKLSEKAKKQTGEKNPNFGHKCSEKLKSHYSKLFKNKKNKNTLTISKPFIINDDTYVLLKDAAEVYNVSYLTIRYRLLSKSEKFSNYKYIEDENKVNEILLEYEKIHLK